MELLLNGVIYLFIFALGAAIGSFLNVIIYRIPAGVSILHPPSRCPQCHHRLGWGENIPVLGWLKLRGKCKHCQSPIAVRYPLVEAATGLLFMLVFWQFGYTLETLGYWALVSWLVALSLIDWDTYTLPNPLTQSGLVVGLGFMLVWGWQETGMVSGAILQLMRGVVGAVLGVWLLDSIAFIGAIALGKTAMGAGDAKLAALLGAWLGWKLLLLGGFLGCVVGALVGGGAIALNLVERASPIPFGPFLALGAILALFWGDFILSTYQSLFFPTI
ncbi:prepilin peptidase [Spirulina sp. CS-785/01]|uniref:prepilin peptidase n=1 Tax=Spirulina sp. CS-785/01 TaxID=3021716 RepID=UPI00232C09C6|nr:A24 family peptidase [Spirulina sp. CS-785/01]MDB9313647.1 prepilin peptidase [Spirulina sp. CS-785/01]